MKKNKLFAFLCCFAALVCTSFLSSCGDDDDDKKFDPSAIYGSWELYGRREIIYDKDGKVLSDETYDFKEHIEYYWAYTFSETTWRMDLYKCAIDDLKKFTIDETKTYNVTYTENSIICKDKDYAENTINYSINGDFLTITVSNVDVDEDDKETFKGAVKEKLIDTYKKVNEKK